MQPLSLSHSFARVHTLEHTWPNFSRIKVLARTRSFFQPARGLRRLRKREPGRKFARPNADLERKHFYISAAQTFARVSLRWELMQRGKTRARSREWLRAWTYCCSHLDRVAECRDACDSRATGVKAWRTSEGSSVEAADAFGFSCMGEVWEHRGSVTLL